jgi:50S ribosomal protein L16 3-hydroxylase
MDVTQALPLLGGISPQVFMKRYWQKKPLLVRQAVPGFKPLLDRAQLFDLAANEDAQTRMVIQEPGAKPGWRFKHGPFQRRALPPLKQAGWTILVQGVDLHHDRVHDLMSQFRFVPDARLDDLMISYATDGGGVGPHYDSYDVFLLQAQGQRRWRIGRQKDLSLQPDVPLKILANFEPEAQYVLEPGDLLYLPPRYAHDGIAVGECMTYSIGFRIPNRAELARELLQRLAEEAEEAVGVGLYRDPDQPAVGEPAEIPARMLAFAQDALQDALQDSRALARGLGEYMTEPKPNVWFEAQAESADDTQAMKAHGICLDRRTRMMFDAHHIFINGESFSASGRDATLMRALANARHLTGRDVAKLSAQALVLLASWCSAGWLHAQSGANL